jgi:hypothetical protein
MLTVEGNAVFILECATEDIQGTSDGEVYSSVSSLVYGFQIVKALGPTSIGAGNGGSVGEFFDQLQIDTGLFALNIDCVDKEFGTV